MNDMAMGADSHDILGWLIVFTGSIITVWTIVIALREVLRPREDRTDHPKYSIFKDGR
ncbi:MAG: hypothetical protein M3Z14_03150 [Candidatus Eremiobacteraeota bacterium]|nr:hypothetical protein [Candidatus Eremiobacteraeota bacterium]